MSHRKFERPRHGSLAFTPRKRASSIRPSVRAFPKDNRHAKPHLTAFVGYKAGCTHIVRELDKPGSKSHKKEIVESVTLIDTPPIVITGLVGYTATRKGLRTVGQVWAQHLSESVKRRLLRSSTSKAQPYAKYAAQWSSNKVKRAALLKRIANKSNVIRVLAHTQIEKVNQQGSKRAHVLEVQVNGGTIKQKIAYALALFEKKVPVEKVFNMSENIDVIGVTRGFGVQGVVQRWGVKKLPRKTHRGLRKVACIGAWHPSRVARSVPRAGQQGFHNRVHLNKKIFRIGRGSDSAKAIEGGSTDFDLTKKTINPMSGFPRYGLLRNDFIMVKGSVMGPKKRVIVLRQSVHPPTSRASREKVSLKWIDTSTKLGRGRFQTSDEKKKFLGAMKKDIAASKAAESK